MLVTPCAAAYFMAPFSMTSQELNSAKKSMGRPRVDSEAINVRLQRPFLDALDKVQADFDLKSRPDAVRFVLKEWMQSQDRMPLDTEKD